MDIRFDQVPDGTRVPGMYIEINRKFTKRGLPANDQRVLLVAQRLAALIEPARFQGGGLNDAASGGAFTGLARKSFMVQISTAGATDKFRYSTDSGVTWSEEAALDGTPQALEDGVTVQFAATTGHAAGDEWRFAAWPEPTVSALTPSPVYSEDDAAAQCGFGSVAHLMARAAYAANRYLDLSVITLDEAGGSTAAQGDATVTGQATANGTLTLYVAGVRIQVGYAKDDTAADIAFALQAELERVGGLPVTFAVDAAIPEKVNFTARSRGTLGNAVHLAAAVSANTGVAVAVTDMAGGATDPDVSLALAEVAAVQYDIIATAFSDQASLTSLRDHLDSVTDAVNHLAGIGVCASVGPLADAVTRSASQDHHLLVNKWLRYNATKRRSTQFEVAAAFASVMAFETDPALPLNNLRLTGIAPQAVTDVPTRTELESCLKYNGVSPLTTDRTGNVRIVRAITTYVHDEQGNEDQSWLDVTTPRSLFYIRRVYRELADGFSRVKLTAGQVSAIRGVFVGRLKQLEEMGIVENVDANLPGLVMERPADDPGRLNAKIPVDLVNGLHVLAVRIDPTL